MQIVMAQRPRMAAPNAKKVLLLLMKVRSLVMGNPFERDGYAEFEGYEELAALPLPANLPRDILSIGGTCWDMSQNRNYFYV